MSKSVVREDNQVTLEDRLARVQVTVLAADLIRVRMIPSATFGPDESWAVAKTDWPTIPVDVRDEQSVVRMETSEPVVEIRKSPLRITFRDKTGRVIDQDEPGKGMSWDGDVVRVWKMMPSDQYFYGLAMHGYPVEIRGKDIVNWNTDVVGYRRGDDPLYQSIPFFMSIRQGRSYGVLLDNTYRSSFDLGKEYRDQYSFGAEDGELNYYFFYGPDPKKVIARYTELVGRMPLPPRWTLGYQQARWSYQPESQVREIVNTFRLRNIPLDAIWLDIDYMDGYRCFTVDKEKFPTFRQMVADLASVGVNTLAIIDPGIKREPGYWVYDEGKAGDHFVKNPDGSEYTGDVWPGTCVFPDFTRSETREWWGTLYKGLIEDGVAGFWNDMNEPTVFYDSDIWEDRLMPIDVIHDDRGQRTTHRKSHNVYGMLMAKASVEGIKKLQPDRRPFVLSRVSFAGGHRYAATWTGDNTAKYTQIHLWIQMTLSLGLSGQPFSGPDIGGFFESPTPELFTRFLQSGIFSPLSRTHIHRETKMQEPWSYGPAFEAINRRYIELRYRLMPYIYTVFEEAARTGIPVARSLVLEYPEDRETYRLDTEFLFGPDLLVAPVFIPGATSREVYLPAGEWFDFWTGEKMVGPKEVNVEAPIDVLPLFARGGAIIPMQQVVQYVDEAPVDPLTLSIFPSGESTSTLYEDDGLSYEYQNGGYARTSFRCQKTAEQIRLDIGRREGRYEPPARSLMLQINAVDTEPQRVQRTGQDLPRIRTRKRLEQLERGWVYDGLKNIVWIKLPDEGREERIVVQ